MNKAITDGITFTPPPFSGGLNVWSSGDGTPGSDTYDNAANAAFVPSDPDFGGSLEILKTASTTKVRYTGQTSIIPGCYLQVRARVKVISGALPNVRIAGYAARSNGSNISGVVQVGPTTTLTTFGDVVEVTAIVGTGVRNGVDMSWGPDAVYGHFGLDLTGPNGGVVRIDDIAIEDITVAFLSDMVGLVDVRDFGALGDGSTDDHAAFEAADAAADGRDVLIPAGVFFLGDSVTMDSRCRFLGTVTMSDSHYLTLQQNFNLPDYIDAFGSGELAFRKAFQSMLKGPDHVELDMAGLKIDLREPIDLHAAVPDVDSFSNRRVISNGQLSVVPGPNWDTETFTSQATYNPNDPRTLTNVQNVANIPVGSLVEGNGVGREVYVRSKNVGQETIELSLPLHDASGTQNYTFRRFKYMLDFTGFNRISRFSIDNIEFLCRGDCNALILPPTGIGFHLRDCWVNAPRERGITSHGTGCQGMMIDRCQFVSNESALLVAQRTTIGCNLNANDVKIRNNRCRFFRHFAVIGGTSSIISGNHFFQGDSGPVGPRTAILVMANTNSRATIEGNYICDGSIEWTNERDPAPEFNSEFSFSAMSITGNTFLSQSTSPSFNFILVKPFGTDHFINGLMVTGNTFRLIDGNIDRVEGIDTTFAELNFERFKNIHFTANAYNGVNTLVESPLVWRHDENSPQSTWVVTPSPHLPFNAWVRTVESVMPEGEIQDNSGNPYWGMPYAQPRQGPNNDRVNVRWEKPVQGTVVVRMRIDNPIP
ncbi:MAG: right-handed parallel beta-helix repeat-containing protein [Pseudomonadota bacterium]